MPKWILIVLFLLIFLRALLRKDQIHLNFPKLDNILEPMSKQSLKFLWTLIISIRKCVLNKDKDHRSTPQLHYQLSPKINRLRLHQQKMIRKSHYSHTVKIKQDLFQERINKMKTFQLIIKEGTLKEQI